MAERMIRLPFTDKDLEALDEEDESKYSDPLWEEAKRQREEAISLEEYIRQRGLDKLFLEAPERIKLAPG